MLLFDLNLTLTNLVHGPGTLGCTFGRWICLLWYGAIFEALKPGGTQGTRHAVEFRIF